MNKRVSTLSSESKPNPAPLQARSLLKLALLACLVGALVGLVSACFRLALQRADSGRDALIAWAHGRPWVGFLFVAGVMAGTAALACWLVQRFSPHAGGSGIPHVEAVVNGELPPAPFGLLPVKFVGGWLAIGGGLALGREGPSVQMGASIGSLLGGAFRLNHSDCVALLAGGGGAGLATAFNAPIAGAVFVLEELVRRFDTRIAVAALAASAGAIAVARPFVGQLPDFQVELPFYSGVGSGFLFVALGLLAGLVGVAYNRSLLGALAIFDRLRDWPPPLRAAVVGAGVGAIAWFGPALVGGGDALTQRALSNRENLAWLPLLFAFRFVLGTVSYATGTPGGLFAPMLVLGAQLGLLFAALCQLGLPNLGVPPAAFAAAGMAAFFTAVVRSPVTGIILAVELTNGFTQLLPMLWACFAAMTVPTLLGNEPIYDSLKERLPRPPAQHELLQGRLDAAPSQRRHPDQRLER
jgi:CIC family chloride channel protein